MQKSLLHRDDPDRPALTGNVKVTREDWLSQARDVLVAQGVAHVKILPLAESMGVSRSSFYWYFKNMQELLDALAEYWRTKNTGALIAQSQLPAGSICEAVFNVQRCVVNPALFETALDFAMRDWARADADIRALILASDAARIEALTAMFIRFDFPAREAETRAFTLYYQQIGYDLADLGHSMEHRLSRVSDYIYVFTGQYPSAAEVEAFCTYARAHWPKKEERRP